MQFTFCARCASCAACLRQPTHCLGGRKGSKSPHRSEPRSSAAP